MGAGAGFDSRLFSSHVALFPFWRVSGVAGVDCGEKGKKENRQQRGMTSNPMSGGMNWFMRGCQSLFRSSRSLWLITYNCCRELNVTNCRFR